MPEIGLFGSEGGAPTHGVPTLSVAYRQLAHLAATVTHLKKYMSDSLTKRDLSE